jgi:branched-chain amino acid aminotransferase
VAEALRLSKAWLDGQVVDSTVATTSPLAFTLQYGLGAFEGLRSYQWADGRRMVFRLSDHVARLLYSSRVATIEVSYSSEQLVAACLDLLRANDIGDSYLRPTVFLGDHSIGIGSSNPTHVFIAQRRFPSTLYASKEISVCVSPLCRSRANGHLAKAKLCGAYFVGAIAKRQALAAGFDEAILLDDRGQVTEATAENVFVVKSGAVYTPGSSLPLLAGITRETLMRLPGLPPVEEREFGRELLDSADEIFLAGTAAEITGISHLDGRLLGPNPVTRLFRDAYTRLMRAQTEAAVPEGWFTFY